VYTRNRKVPIRLELRNIHRADSMGLDAVNIYNEAFLCIVGLMNGSAVVGAEMLIVG